MLKKQKVRDGMSFWRDTKGGSLILFAIALPILVALTGMVIDYASMSSQSRKLQSAADSAALAAAKELFLANADPQAIARTAERHARAQLAEDGEVSVIASVVERGEAVMVEISQTPTLFFTAQLTGGRKDPVTRRAVARASAAGGRICVLGLATKGPKTIFLDSNATLTAANCGVFSNSTHRKGLSSLSNARLRSGLTCTAGGFEGGHANYEPQPVVDCPPLEDPLADRPTVRYGRCDYDDVYIVDQTRTLKPGVYCGGLTIDGNSNIRLSPGIYVIKDGPLKVNGNSKFVGDYVGFFLTGEGAKFKFKGNAEIDLSAPKDGQMAGMLIFEDRAGGGSKTNNTITTNYAHTLIGTIYLPNGRLVVDASNDVAQNSAYTAVIVRSLELKNNPNLVLNSNYEQTDVPVPDGIFGTAEVRLDQ